MFLSCVKSFCASFCNPVSFSGDGRSDTRPFKKLYIPAELDKDQQRVNANVKKPTYDEKFKEWLYGKEEWKKMRGCYKGRLRNEPIAERVGVPEPGNQDNKVDSNADGETSKLEKADCKCTCHEAK